MTNTAAISVAEKNHRSYSTVDTHSYSNFDITVCRMISSRPLENGYSRVDKAVDPQRRGFAHSGLDQLGLQAKSTKRSATR